MIIPLTEQAIIFLEEGLILEATEDLVDEIDLQEQIMEIEFTDGTIVGPATS